MLLSSFPCQPRLACHAARSAVELQHAVPSSLPPGAVHETLAGLPLRQVSSSRQVGLLVEPARHEVPFAVALDLQQDSAARVSGQEPAYEEGAGLFELQYILEGATQGADGSQPAAGDSALSWLAPGQPAQPSRSAACLTMLLPAQHLTAEQGQAQLQAALEPWLAAPVTGHLSAAAAQQLLTGVSRLAGQALGGRSASRPGGPHSVTSDLLGQVRQMPEMAVRRLMEGLLRSWRQPEPIAGQKPPEAAAGADRSHAQPADSRRLRKLRELTAMHLPQQTNRMALVFDPLNDPVPFTFGVEVFEPSHRTTPHQHAVGYELFLILSGEGSASCNGHTFPVSAGEVVVFPPTSLHAIDNGSGSRHLFSLELMMPNDMFAELVAAGSPAGRLRDEDLCALISAGCR